MGSSGILDFRKIALFLCMTSGLTLSVNDGSNGTNGTTPTNVKPLENGRELGGSLKVDEHPFVLPSSTVANTVEAEGGPIQFQATIANATANNVTRDLNNETIANKERKVPKIVARKGARLSSMENINETISTVRPSTQMDIARSSEENEESKLNTQLKNTQNVHLNGTLKTEESISTTTTEKAPIVSTSKIPPTIRKHKPKPTVTIGESGIDKPIPASPTKSPPLGMSRKIDYIVPVVVTIVPLPFVAIAIFILYKRGRDCWDKRHYRRMDFLIDGMYND